LGIGHQRGKKGIGISEIGSGTNYGASVLVRRQDQIQPRQVRTSICTLDFWSIPAFFQPIRVFSYLIITYLVRINYYRQLVDFVDRSKQDLDFRREEARTQQSASFSGGAPGHV
jgi:hypothetical protein